MPTEGWGEAPVSDSSNSGILFAPPRSSARGAGVSSGTGWRRCDERALDSPAAFACPRSTQDLTGARSELPVDLGSRGLRHLRAVELTSRAPFGRGASDDMASPLIVGLLEHEMSNSAFEIPVDYRDRRKIERSVRTHHHPDPARDCKDRPEHKSRDHRLLDAWKPLVGVMAQGKQRGSDQDDGYSSADSTPE